MGESVTGDAVATSISVDTFAHWLENYREGRQFLQECARCWTQVKSAKEQDSLIARLCFVICALRRLALGWYRRLRIKLCPSFRLQLLKHLREQELEKSLQEARKRAQEVERRVRAKSLPERSTDFALKVKLQISDNLALQETDVSISYGDSLDDVFVRYSNALKERGASEDDRYNALNQPDWLVVQQGETVDKRGFAVSNFSLVVADLEITASDTLVFMCRRLGAHTIFFKRYAREDAISNAPKASRAKQAWEAWKQASPEQYAALKNPDKVRQYLTTMGQNSILGLQRRSWTLDGVQERPDGQVHFIIDGCTYRRYSDGSCEVFG